MCIHDNQFQVTPLSIKAFYDFAEADLQRRMKNLDAYQAEMAARDAALAERRFERMFRLRRALNRWAPRVASWFL